MKESRSRPWLTALLASLLTVTLIIGGFALAQTDGGDTFTGCLKSNGELAKLAIGGSPSQACSPSETLVSWNSEGPAGEAGATWYSGVNAPDSSLGTNGDLFLLLADNQGAEAGDVFVKQDGTWVTDATLGGPAGPPGPEGPPGPAGEPGTRALRVDLYEQNPPFSGLPKGTWVPILSITADAPGSWLLDLEYQYGFLPFGGILESTILNCRLVDSEGSELYSDSFIGSGELSQSVIDEADVVPIVAESNVPTAFTFECQDELGDFAVGAFVRRAELVGIAFGPGEYVPSSP